jgi:hypothetical protein
MDINTGNRLQVTTFVNQLTNIPEFKLEYQNNNIYKKFTVILSIIFILKSG